MDPRTPHITHHVLKLHCPDAPGLMARISAQITAHNFNVTSSHGELVAPHKELSNFPRSPLSDSVLRPPSLVAPSTPTPASSTTISRPPIVPPTVQTAEWRMHTEIEGYYNPEDDKKQLELLIQSMRQELPTCKRIWTVDEPTTEVVPKEAVVLDKQICNIIHPHNVPQRCYEAFQHYSNGGYVSTNRLMQLLSDCGLQTTHSHTRDWILRPFVEVLFFSLSSLHLFVALGLFRRCGTISLGVPFSTYKFSPTPRLSIMTGSLFCPIRRIEKSSRSI